MYRLWVNVECIGIGLILYVSALDWRLVNWFLRDSFLWERTKAVHFVLFVVAHFNGLVFTQSLAPPSCHSARRACPELQNPLYQLAKDVLLPGEEMPTRADEGWGKCSWLTLTHRLRRSPLSPWARVMLDNGFCDFALGSAQNDRTEDSSRIMRVCSIREIIRSYQWKNNWSQLIS